MILRKGLFFLLFIFAAGLCGLAAAETTDRHVRLIIDEKTGHFSLYYLADAQEMHYEPLFNSIDPSTSFSVVNVNGKVYRLGKSRTFKTKIEKIDGNPAVVYESSFLQVSLVFFPVSTASSHFANGIRISVNIKNKSEQEASVGFRMLIDTHLGERQESIPFVTDNLNITKETLLDGESGETYWISRGEQVSLMGNIVIPPNYASRNPDFVHFANWKKLSDVPWKARLYKGKAFNHTPYSVGDSAVCYYYEPSMMASGESSDFFIFLTTEDTAWYFGTGVIPQTAVERVVPVAAQTQANDIAEIAMEEAAIFDENIDLLTLRKLQGILEQFIAGEINLNEQDLSEIEMTLGRYENRY